MVTYNVHYFGWNGLPMTYALIHGEQWRENWAPVYTIKKAVVSDKRQLPRVDIQIITEDYEFAVLLNRLVLEGAREYNTWIDNYVYQFSEGNVTKLMECHYRGRTEE